MRKNLILACGMMGVILLASSCASRSKIVYLQDMEQGQRYLYDAKYQATVHSNDRLNITVSCKRPELAIPFNTMGKSIQVGADGNVSTSSVAGSTAQGYRVDVDGNIDFPILGKLHVEGMKVNEVTDMIRDKIIEGNYIKDPSVSLEFLNFKYTVLGAVGSNGTYTVKDDRITLLEAIANAGDVAQNGRIDRVSVIREVNGEREIYTHDLRSKAIFTSPCFYLQQNDIVYVEPKYKKKDKEERGFQIGTLIISLASMVTSILWVLKK